MTKLKDKRKIEDCSGVVYSIPCNDCDKTYVGQTKRKLKDRLKEHQADVRHSRPNSKIYQHKRDCDHSMNFEEAKVLYHCGRTEQRLFLEAWATNDTTLNRAIELNDAYNALKNDV